MDARNLIEWWLASDSICDNCCCYCCLDQYYDLAGRQHSTSKRCCCDPCDDTYWDHYIILSLTASINTAITTWLAAIHKLIPMINGRVGRHQIERTLKLRRLVTVSQNRQSFLSSPGRKTPRQHGARQQNSGHVSPTESRCSLAVTTTATNRYHRRSCRYWKTANATTTTAAAALEQRVLRISVNSAARHPSLAVRKAAVALILLLLLVLSTINTNSRRPSPQHHPHQQSAIIALYQCQDRHPNGG